MFFGEQSVQPLQIASIQSVRMEPTPNVFSVKGR